MQSGLLGHGPALQTFCFVLGAALITFALPEAIATTPSTATRDGPFTAEPSALTSSNSRAASPAPPVLLLVTLSLSHLIPVMSDGWRWEEV